MSANWLVVAGSTGLAVASVAVPAEAQYYPPPPPQQQQQYYPPPPSQGGIGNAIVGQVLGYGRYPYGNYGYETYGNERYGIDRCARAVEQRLGGYNNNNNYYSGYNTRRYRNFGRVEGITRVERKKYGLKVTGVASSGYGGYQGWNQRGYGTYGYGAGADLRFECKVHRNGQIRDIDIKRRTANWRGY